MPQVIDSSGASVDIAPEELPEAWKSGRVQLVAGARYHVALPDGRMFLVPAESLHTALESGGRVVSEADAARHADDREYGGVKGGLIAAGGGALEQATMGLGDYALPDSWRVAIEKSQGLHPYATMAGQGIGMAGLAAATGGVGELAGLGGALEGGVAGLVERGAAATLRAAAGGEAEAAAARMATRAAVQGLRGAAEGAQFGAAREIGEHALSPEDHPLTAASILSHIGGDALWGGALGAGAGLLGGASEALRSGRLERALVDARAPAPEDVGAVAARALGTEPAEGLGSAVKSWYAKLASAASGAPEDQIKTFAGGMFDEGSIAYENRKLLLEADEIRATASRDIRQHVDDVLAASRKVMEEGQGQLKREKIRAAVEGVDGERAAQHATDLVGDALQTLDKMAAEPNKFGGAKPIENATEVAMRVARKLNGAIARGDVAEQYGLVDDLKKALGKYTRGASQLSPRAATDELVSMQNTARAAELQQLYERLRTGLEDEGIWGKAAENQRAVNRAWTRQIDASDRFHRALTTEVGRDPENPWQSIRGVDPAKAESFVKNLTNPSQDLTHKAVTDYVSATRDLAGAMRDKWDLPPAKLAQVERLSTAANAFQAKLDEASRALSLVNQFDAIREHTGSQATGLLMAAAGLSHGIPGGAMAMGMLRLGQSFTRPAEAIMRLARVEGIVRRTDSRIGRAVRSFLRGGTRADESMPLESFERRSGQVQELGRDPGELHARMRVNVARLGQVSPRLGTALMGASIAGLSLLQSKLPVRPAADPIDPGAKVPPPPPAQREAWLRYYRAVKDPLSVVEDLQAGRLSIEGVDVLKQVYPPLYARVQQSFFAELADGRGADLTAQQRIGLVLLLDLPTPTLAPEYIRERQAAYVAAPPEPAGAPQSRRSKPVNITAMQSPAERVESGPATRETA